MQHIDKPTRAEAHQCVPIPDFERLNFYYGQALGVADFQAEQRYFLEKLRLHNRCFHGYGIVCGLDVKPMPVGEDCASDEERRVWELKKLLAEINKKIAELEETAKKQPENETVGAELEKLNAEREELQRDLEKHADCFPRDRKAPAEICVDCGWAVDCEGREIIVRQPLRVDLWSLLSALQKQEVKQAVEDGRNNIFVELSICYCEQPTYPSRPVVTDTCAPVSKCVYGRTREGFKLRVGLLPSEPDQRCSNCCETCDNECVVLAHLDWDPTQPITGEQIELRPRRDISLYKPTVITGISWRHGATYAPTEAKKVLGTGHKQDGIEVTFSKPVNAETLQGGVVEFICFKGGKGVSGEISHMQGSFVGKPKTGWVESFRYRDDTNETLNHGDRVLIIIRGNFILDACCRPVDAEHVGGLVPQLEKYKKDGQDEKSLPPVPPCAETRRQPWTSGSGRPGSTFESWFFIS